MSEYDEVSRPLLVKNDYSQYFVDKGELPQNFIRDYGPESRFKNYKSLGKITKLKNEIRAKRAHPAQCIKADLKTFDWSTLPCQFDVLLVDPPWEEYQNRTIGLQTAQENLTPWSLQEIMDLPIKNCMASPSFCFIWAGTEHKEDARKVLISWGYRRCEDIVWLKSNLNRVERFRDCRPDDDIRTTAKLSYQKSLFIRSKEHCLIGIKGTVRRSIDSHFIHSNMDIDVIMDDYPLDLTTTQKPEELYDVIERFCLSRRRLELFGCDRNVRPGWLTIGENLRYTKYNPIEYMSFVENMNKVNADGEDKPVGYPDIEDYKGGRYLGSTDEIEHSRPRSPTKRPLENNKRQTENNKRQLPNFGPE